MTELRHYFVRYPTGPDTPRRTAVARAACWRCHRPAGDPIHLEPDDAAARDAAITAAAPNGRPASARA